MTGAPAVAGNDRLDILATNPLRRALYCELYRDPVRPANHGRFAFLDPRAQDFWVDWERAANDTVGVLRAGSDLTCCVAVASARRLAFWSELPSLSSV